MKRVPRGFHPPPRKPQDAPPAPVELYQEPIEDVVLLGEMLYDAKTMSELLGGLPFEREHYRANLRIVAGAADRMRKRCARLLVEEEDISEELAALEVSNIIDTLPPEPEPKRPSGRPQRDRTQTGKPPRPARERNLGSPAAVPVPGGVKAGILKQLSRQPLTSVELAERLGGPSGSVYSTLTNLRGEGLIKTKVDEQDGQRKNYLIAQPEQAASA